MDRPDSLSPSSPEQEAKFSARTLILGGSGFIGGRVTSLLKNAQVPVDIGDLRPSEAFPDLWTECDVRNADSLAAPFQGVGAVINLAAEHRDDVRPVSRYWETNVDGAARVCEAARRAGVAKIIFTSSVAVYGFHPRPVNEDGPFTPFNDYGRTKLEAEGIYRQWAAEDPLRSLVIVRPTVVFGEGNRGNVYNLLRQIATGKFVMVGSGSNVKSMAYVGNLAAFLVHTLELGPGVHIFNYVDGPDMNTSTLVTHILSCLGRPEKLTRIPKSLALASGHLLDAVARLSGMKFPISAIRVRKFCEATQFNAERIADTGFKRPFTLSEALTKTVQSEFTGR